jgi:hypothetical protein
VLEEIVIGLAKNKKGDLNAKSVVARFFETRLLTVSFRHLCLEIPVE